MPRYIREVRTEDRFFPFRHDLRKCPEPSCGGELTYSHQTSGRTVFRLTGPVHAVSQTVYCTNGRCALKRQEAIVHPVEELALAPPGWRIGSDVIAKIGQMRFGERLKRAQIRSGLVEEFGLLLSETTVQNAADLYGALVQLGNLEDPRLVKELRTNRVVILSVDGAKPIRGDDVVWFVRDVVSGRTLLADALTSSRIEDLTRLLVPVREFLVRHGIALGGIIIDAEANLQAAMEQVFPNVPIQLCQLHYVSNLAKATAPHDRALRKTLQVAMKEVHQLARDVAARRGVGGELSYSQASVLNDLFRSLLSILKDTGKPPYKPGGLRMYERLLQAEQAVAKMRRRAKLAPLRDLHRMLGVVRQVRDDAQWLRVFYQDILAMSEALFAENATSASVRREVSRLWDAWKEDLARRRASDPKHAAVSVLTSWLTTTTNYAERLFTTYRHPQLPRTNNGTEQMIGAIKQLTRTLSGRPNPVRRFKREAVTRAIFHNRAVLPGEHFINSRRPEDLRLARQLLAARQRERSIEYQARADFSGLLARLQERMNGPPNE